MICYTTNAKIIEDGPSAYAKEENGKFFIKVVQTGQDAGHFINTQSMWFVNELTTSKLTYKGTNALEYKPVSKYVFDLYVKYLETQNPAYYRNAERNNI